jgi:tetratricopeptide (TPR) repeat protein
VNRVSVSVENMVIPSYENAAYEEYPMFAFSRIHQGATGNPFPHRVVNKLRHDNKVDRSYTAVHLENEYLDLILLPELGGRIFAARDKTNGCDFFYRHHEIKPALIGIYGLWISGGVEFNWPRHHRASTFMPTDFAVERTDCGGAIVWMSEHDPLFRMKGMVGVALYPGKALLETRMKVFNRTPLPHAFHWWENAGIPVNKDFQVFFPPDVTYVNYHYRKATGAYPVMDEYFYVQDNRGGKDIRFHKNTEEAASYFSGNSKYDFFGGYDHGKETGIIHYASHYTSSGKKMFTWGYRNRGKSWQSALTDSGGDYVELMASSYGDNQPDFSWLEPWEVKEFSQTWYPFKSIGEPQAATDKAALRYSREGNDFAVHVYATEDMPRAVLEIGASGTAPIRKTLYLEAAAPQRIVLPGRGDLVGDGLSVSLRKECGVVALSYIQETPKPYVPEPIDNVPHPDSFANAADCCAAGIHIDQYYDPVNDPDTYWLKGLSLDPEHAGCLTNLGRNYITREDYAGAEEALRKAVKSLTRYNPNPRDGEALYLLGLVLIKRRKPQEALEFLHKALWDRAQIIPGSCAIACVYSSTGEFARAERLLLDLIRQYGRNQRAVELLITMLRKQGKTEAALEEALKLLACDPLDLHALNELRLLGDSSLAEERFKCRRAETGIDIAADYALLGLFEDALEIIQWIEAGEEPVSMLLYAAGYMEARMGNSQGAEAKYARAEKAPQGMRFASLAFEGEALANAITVLPSCPRAHLELGNLIYGIRRKTAEAVAEWKEALRLAPDSVQAMRNLALGLFALNNDDTETLALLEKALRQKPKDLQLLYERNLVMELQHVDLEDRLKAWETMKAAPDSWDDLYLQGIRILSQMGKWDRALELLLRHTFVPAEGVEMSIGLEYGSILECLGYNALSEGKSEEALRHFRDALNSPLSIGGGLLHRVCFCPYKYGEAKSLLRLGRIGEAGKALSWIADFPLNYFTLSLLPSYLYYRGMALAGLGRKDESAECFKELRRKAEEGLAQKEYGFFASIPGYVSYIKDPGKQRRIHYSILLALALGGFGEEQEALARIAEVLRLDPENVQAQLAGMTIRASCTPQESPRSPTP